MLARHAPLCVALSAGLLGCAAPVQQRVPTTQEIDGAATVLAPRTRLSGELPVLPPATEQRHGSYRVCATADGARVLSVTPVLPLGQDDAAVAAALRSWSYRAERPAPAGQPLCFLEHLSFSPAGQGAVAEGPFILLETERDQRPGDALPRVPLELTQRYEGQTLVGLYRLCLDEQSGAVREVAPLVPVPDANQTLGATLKSWRYRPTGRPTCVVEILHLGMTPDQAASAISNTYGADYLSKLPQSRPGNPLQNIAPR